MTAVDERPSLPISPAPLGIEEFYRTTKKRMLDTALRLAAGNLDLANEATQMAYVEMWRRWSQRQHFPPEANRRYATKVAANKIADHFRSRKDLGWLEDLIDHGASQFSSSEPAFDAVHDAIDGRLPEYRMLLTIIDEQPARRRAVATLFFLEELGYDEIAT